MLDGAAPTQLVPDSDGRLPLWRALPPPLEALRCVIVLPVRDEASGIEIALQALASQRLSAASLPGDNGFEVVVLANNCRDDTAQRARLLAQRQLMVPVHVLEACLPPPFANIGYVRGQLFDVACSRLQAVGHPGAFIASTDGDSRVESGWLEATAAEIQGGADAVGGRILTEGGAALGAATLRMQRADAAHSLLHSRLASLIDPEAHDPWPRHHQHFGASLAVTAKAYLAAGGMPKVEVLEDMALVRALRRVDRKVRHAPGVRVRTSSRLDGRAAVGLSWQLRQWAGGGPAAVDPPVLRATHSLALMQARHDLRAAWQRADSSPRALASAAVTFSLAPTVLQKRLATTAHFGTLWDDLWIEWSEQSRHVRDLEPMSQALIQLRQALRQCLAASQADQGASSSGGLVPAASNTSRR